MPSTPSSPGRRWSASRPRTSRKWWSPIRFRCGTTRWLAGRSPSSPWRRSSARPSAASIAVIRSAPCSSDFLAPQTGDTSAGLVEVLAKRGVPAHDRIRDREDRLLPCARADFRRGQWGRRLGTRWHRVGGIDEGRHVLISARPDLHGDDQAVFALGALAQIAYEDRKSTRLNSSHVEISYAV